MKNILFILISVSLNAAAQIFMRRGMLQTGEVSFGAGTFFTILPMMFKSGLLWLSVLCYGVSLILWMIVLSKVEVSFAYAFSSLGYVLVVIMGAIILKEHISPLRVTGILIVCAGIILVAKG